MKHCLWIGFNGIYWELSILLEWVVMFRPKLFFFLTLFLSCLCVSLEHGGDFFFIIILTSGSTFHSELKKTGAPLACASALSLSNIRSNSHALSRSG